MDIMRITMNTTTTATQTHCVVIDTLVGGGIVGALHSTETWVWYAMTMIVKKVLAYDNTI